MKHIKLFENYNKKVFYHGTQNIFDTFKYVDNGIYFTDIQHLAEDYGHIIVKAYLNYNNPLILDAEGRYWHYYERIDNNITNAIKKAKMEKNDIIIIKNMHDPRDADSMEDDEGNDLYDPNDVYIVIDQNIIEILK